MEYINIKLPSIHIIFQLNFVEYSWVKELRSLLDICESSLRVQYGNFVLKRDMYLYIIIH